MAFASVVRPARAFAASVPLRSGPRLALASRLPSRLPSRPSIAPLPAAPRAEISSAMAPVRIAVAQMTSGNDIDANFESAKSLIEEASRRGCSLVCLPENFHFLGTHFSQSLAIAEPVTGEGARSIRRYRALAREHGLWLSLGGFQERTADPGRVHNCHVIIDSGGNVRATYRKIYLFDVDVPGGASFRESAFTAPGGEAVAAGGSPVGTLGLSTCYDLRFPELYQHLAHDLGADVLLVPAAFTRPTGAAHWDALLRARAIETQTFVVAAAQAGVHNEKRASYGHARVFSPWGDLVTTPDDPDAPGIAVAEIDLDAIKEVRSRMPVAQHRRNAKARAWWKDDGVEEGKADKD